MLLSKSFLKEMAVGKKVTSEYRADQVITENSKIFSSKNKNYDIFLSHSYLDKDLVLELVDIFNKANYSVYVDWIIDTQLDRSLVNKKTSELLRRRMDSSKSLAYIATGNTTNSKWCPWELGYVDGKKNSRCAILPVLENRTNQFKGQEYLGIYPYIEYAQKRNSPVYDFWVFSSDDNNSYIILSEWLKGNEPYKH